MAVNPYAKAVQATETASEREYRLLARANRMLEDTKETQSIADLYRAVLFNRQVWNTFLIDLTDERNQLPTALKGSLISIGIWVEKFSDQVCDGDEPVDDLIEVNRSIMEGLAAQREAANP